MNIIQEMTENKENIINESNLVELDPARLPLTKKNHQKKFLETNNPCGIDTCSNSQSNNSRMRGGVLEMKKINSKAKAYIMDSPSIQSSQTKSQQSVILSTANNNDENSNMDYNQEKNQQHQDSNLIQCQHCQYQNPFPLRHQHHNFCIDCCQYYICDQCLELKHSSHMILTFDTQNEAKEMTKQFLIEKLEDTLMNLKSTENSMKNENDSLELIRMNVKRIEEETLQIVKKSFERIEKGLGALIERQEQEAVCCIRRFYDEYNWKSQQLRDSLLSIIEEDYGILGFDSEKISSQNLPQIPLNSVSKLKQNLQKTKNFFKTLQKEVLSIEEKIESFSFENQPSNGDRKFNPNKAKGVNKYEKFLTQGMSLSVNRQNKVGKKSLMRILENSCN